MVRILPRITRLPDARELPPGASKVGGDALLSGTGDAVEVVLVELQPVSRAVTPIRATTRHLRMETIGYAPQSFMITR
jgi:hypothetical protein